MLDAAIAKVVAVASVRSTVLAVAAPSLPPPPLPARPTLPPPVQKNDNVPHSGGALSSSSSSSGNRGNLGTSVGAKSPKCAAPPSPAELPEPSPQGQRRVTHDGVMAGGALASPLAPEGSRQRAPPPKSAPPARRARVRWAPDVASPKLSREALHKRAREITMAQLQCGESSGSSSIAEGAKRQRRAPSRLDD